MNDQKPRQSNLPDPITRHIVLYFKCRDIGYGIETGRLDGCFTGEIDTWGKHTFLGIDGQLYFFFRDEIQEWI